MDLNRVIFLLTNGAVDFLITKSSQPGCNDFDMKAKEIDRYIHIKRATLYTEKNDVL